MKSLLHKGIVLFLFASLLIISFSTYFSNKEKPFYLLPMREIKQGDFYLDATFEKVSCPLAIDLGTPNMVLRKEILKQIQNKSENGFSCSVDVNGNNYRTSRYRINKMKIGPMNIDYLDCKEEDLDFILKGSSLHSDKSPDAATLEHLQTFAGRIGSFLFRERNCWLFDFPKLSLYAINDVEAFKKQFRLPFDQFIEAPLEPSYPELIIKIDTDFGTKKFMVDTGAMTTILKPPGEGFSSHQTIHLKKCAINEHELGLNEVYFFNFSKDLGDFDGLLGMDVLRNRALFLDFENNKLFIGPQERPQ